MIAAHVDTQQPRKVLPTQDSSQAKSDQFSVLRSDEVKPPVLNTQTYAELEGLPLAIHQPAPLPANEEERLAALKHLNVLDTAQEQRFDDITQLVCSIFSVPIAIVSLIDTERQWFKSCQGLLCNQTDRKSSFCAWTLVPKNPEVLVVPDATEDVRCVAQPAGYQALQDICNMPNTSWSVQLRCHKQLMHGHVPQHILALLCHRCVESKVKHGCLLTS